MGWVKDALINFGRVEQSDVNPGIASVLIHIISVLSIAPQETDKRLSFFDSIGNRISKYGTSEFLQAIAFYLYCSRDMW